MPVEFMPLNGITSGRDTGGMRGVDGSPRYLSLYISISLSLSLSISRIIFCCLITAETLVEEHCSR